MWPAASLNGSEAPPGACGTDGAAHYATTCLCRGLSEGSTSLCGLCRLVGAVWPLYGRLFLRDRLRRVSVCWRAVRPCCTAVVACCARFRAARPHRILAADPPGLAGLSCWAQLVIIVAASHILLLLVLYPISKCLPGTKWRTSFGGAPFLYLERGRAPGLCELWRRASRSSPTAPSAAAAASATATVDGAPLLAVSRTSGTLVRRAPSRRPCRYEACR